MGHGRKTGESGVLGEGRSEGGGVAEGRSRPLVGKRGTLWRGTLQ